LGNLNTQMSDIWWGSEKHWGGTCRWDCGGRNTTRIMSTGKVFERRGELLSGGGEESAQRATSKRGGWPVTTKGYRKLTWDCIFKTPGGWSTGEQKWKKSKGYGSKKKMCKEGGKEERGGGNPGYNQRGGRE